MRHRDDPRGHAGNEDLHGQERDAQTKALLIEHDPRAAVHLARALQSELRHKKAALEADHAALIDKAQF